MYGTKVKKGEIREGRVEWLLSLCFSLLGASMFSCHSSACSLLPDLILPLLSSLARDREGEGPEKEKCGRHKEKKRKENHRKKGGERRKKKWRKTRIEKQ